MRDGSRVSELIDLRVRDVLLDRNAAVGHKDSKQCAIPLWKNTATEYRAGSTESPQRPMRRCFPTGPAHR